MWFRLAGEGTVGYVAEVQAQIREREKGTATATISWDSIFGSWRMWKDEIAEHYSDNPPARVRADRLMHRVQAQQTLTLSLRALILEPADIWSREEQRVVPALGGRGRVLYRIARSSRIVRGLLRAFILPLHYWSISYRAWLAKRRAQAHLRARPLPFSRVGV
jgi:hypothetical protein